VAAIRHLTELAFDAPVTFFVGENGSEHYQITKAFLDRPERMLNELLRTDDPAEHNE
jgi:predicted ATPase